MPASCARCARSSRPGSVDVRSLAEFTLRVRRRDRRSPSSRTRCSRRALPRARPGCPPSPTIPASRSTRCTARPASTPRAMRARMRATRPTTRKLLRELAAVPDARAHRALSLRDGLPALARRPVARRSRRPPGKAASAACRAARGGFGYDPLFLVDDGSAHRGRARAGRQEPAQPSRPGAARPGRRARVRRAMIDARPDSARAVRAPAVVRAQVPVLRFQLARGAGGAASPSRPTSLRCCDDLEHAAAGAAGRELVSVFFGGGTPEPVLRARDRARARARARRCCRSRPTSRSRSRPIPARSSTAASPITRRPA